MKILICFTLFFSLSVSAKTQFLTTLTSYLDYGHYQGLDRYGDTCYIDVEKNVNVQGKARKATYLVTLLSKNGSGVYHSFSGNPINGGGGDCPTIDVDSGSLLETQNTGQYGICHSNPKRSSSRGLGVYTMSILGFKEIVTYSYRYEEEMSCYLEL